LWDLGAGDIYPVHGVEFDDKVYAETFSGLPHLVLMQK